MLIDTHCHIHESEYPLVGDDVIDRAHKAGVMQMICIGSNNDTSNEALEFAASREGIFASIGVHPHFASDGVGGIVSLSEKANDKLVAIGEIGLDYYYDNSPKSDQIKAIEEQIDLALKLNLPVIFHVRDAYDDFWPVFDNFKGVTGVLHCFTDTVKNMELALSKGLYFGINGIATFTKIEDQKDMFRAIPLDRILLETDAPYLTPNPLRGKIKVNEPAFVREIAEHIRSDRGLSLNELADITTANARALFKL